MNYTKNNLFRGKLKYSNGKYKKGQWVYGDLVRLCDGGKRTPYIYGCGEVYSESIGQNTGRKIGGKEVFDGDILKYGDEILLVGWDRQFLCWRTMDREGDYTFDLRTIIDILGKPCEIIGNITDNPELLKG